MLKAEEKGKVDAGEFERWNEKMRFYMRINNPVLRNRIYNQIVFHASKLNVSNATRAHSGSDYDALMLRQEFITNENANLIKLLNAAQNWALKPKQVIYEGEERYNYSRCGIVEMSCIKNGKSFLGTGFIVSILYGSTQTVVYIVTNKHVVENARQEDIRFNFRVSDSGEASKSFSIIQRFDYKATEEFECDDLSLLVAIIPSKMEEFGSVSSIFEPHSLPLRSKPFTSGIQVFSIGNRGGHGLSFSDGCISQVNASLRLFNDDMLNSGSSTRGDRILKNLVQFNISTNQGASGGPIIDVYGQVVAVVCLQIQSYTPLNYAIPASQVRKLIEQYNATSKYKIQL